MKKSHLFIYILILSIFLIAAPVSLPGAAGQDNERILQEVEVVNILVPIRVFSKGKPVEGLEQKNFTIFENGKEQKINSFQALSKTIKSSVPVDSTGSTDSTETAPAPKEEKGRYFVLAFNVFDFHENVENAVDMFFKDVYRKNDKVVILTPERTFNIENSREMLKSLPVLKKMLTLYSRKARQELTHIFKRLEQEVTHFFEQYDVHQAAKLFLTNYKNIWESYAKKYLIPDVDKFFGFAEVLRDVEMEKWVIIFQQREIFPQFKSRSRIERAITTWITNNENKPQARILEQSLIKLKYAFSVSQNFPLEKLQEEFFRANATFHVLLFKSMKSTHSQDFEYSEAVSDFENSFRSISRATGGDVIFTNKLDESLAKVVQQKDTYYILSYSPKDPHKKNRKLKIKVDGDKKYSVYYIKNLTQREEKKKELATLDIKNFSFKKKLLKLSLFNYLMAKPNATDPNIGLIDLRVMIVHNTNEEVVYNKSNLLKAKNPETNLNIRFDFLKKGQYHLIIDMHDKLANKFRIYTHQIKI